MELNSIVKTKGRKKVKGETAGAGGSGKFAKKKPKALETPTKKGKPVVAKVEKGKEERKKKEGLNVAQMLRQAKELNARMRDVASEYDKEARKLEQATTGRFEKQSKYVTIEEFKAKDPQYKKDIKDLEDRMLAKLNGLKRNRDAALTKAVLGMGYPREVAWIMRETAGTRGFESSMGDVTIRTFDKRVLSRDNIEGNCNEFERYVDQKTLSKESKEVLELVNRAILARREAEESKKG